MPEPCIHDEAAVLDNGTTAICHKASRRGKSAKTARPTKGRQKPRKHPVLPKQTTPTPSKEIPFAIKLGQGAEGA